MESKNETIADIVKDVSGFECYGHISAERAKFIVSDLTRRFEAAHKREVAELKKKCEEYERQPELMADTAKAALELLKAQDSKIAELCECLKEACSLQLRCDSCKIRKCDSICAMKLKWHKAMEGVQK